MMDFSPQLDQYIYESIQHSLGLTVSENTLKLKVSSLEESEGRLKREMFSLREQLKEKNRKIELTRAESNLNAQAIKKFIDENQKLASECSYLVDQRLKLENECFLYEHDRDVLMEFANEADGRARESEARAFSLEQELKRSLEELEFFKIQWHANMIAGDATSRETQFLMNDQLLGSQFGSNISNGDSSDPDDILEESLLESTVTTMLEKDQIEDDGNGTRAQVLLEKYKDINSCQRLVQMWDRLKPTTRNVLEMIVKIKSLMNDKENLRFNLTRAEEEAKALFEENTILYEENQLLKQQYKRERQSTDGDAKDSANHSAHGKRRSIMKNRESLERLSEFVCSVSPRKPLAPLK